MPDQMPPDLVAKATDQDALRRPLQHDSAHKHVSGEALYIDDLPEPAGLLHVYLGLSARPHARILSMDLGPVRAAPGVALVLAGHDVPAHNEISPVEIGRAHV